MQLQIWWPVSASMAVSQWIAQVHAWSSTLEIFMFSTWERRGYCHRGTHLPTFTNLEELVGRGFEEKLINSDKLLNSYLNNITSCFGRTSDFFAVCYHITDRGTAYSNGVIYNLWKSWPQALCGNSFLVCS